MRKINLYVTSWDTMIKYTHMKKAQSAIKIISHMKKAQRANKIISRIKKA